MQDVVLVIDNDEEVKTILQKVLISNQLEVKFAKTTKEAFQLIKKNPYALIILETHVNDGGGFEFIRMVRSLSNDVPIMIISCKTEDYDILYGLGIGADDYITKPFNPIIIGAKIKALIRRSKSGITRNSDILRVGEFEFNKKMMKLYKKNESIDLSSKEALLISFFLENIGRVFSKSQLYEHIWGDTYGDENTIIVYMNHLRNKIEENPKNPKHIKTVWGIGYKFEV